MKRYIHAATIVDNGKIQKGLEFNRDGHRFTVTKVAGNRCEIKEEWIAEDSGRPCKNAESYVIVDDDEHGEYAYLEGDEKYAKPGQEDYRWWARMYAKGADNYPFDWDKL